MQRFKFITVFAGMFFMLASPAWAKTCYTKEEAEAEQGLRIHSELMVIGLNCQHVSSAEEKNLYVQYREFASEHAELFVDYEEKLMQYFKKQGLKDPEAALNTLRTEFANKISYGVARMRPDVFCSRYSPRITKVAGIGHDAVRQWASTLYESHPVSRPLCEQ
jgi:hypothetical protein